MKRFIKNLALFIVMAIPIYIILAIVWGTALPLQLTNNLYYRLDIYGFMNSRIKDLKNYYDVDILFLGSSHCYRGFDPRIFRKHGLSSFNLCSSAQSPIQTEVLLQRYLSQLNPKLVVYEVFPKILCIDGVESALDIISNDRNDIYSFKMALKLNHVKVYNTLIYGIFRDTFSLNRNYRQNRQRKDDTYIPGGFVEKELTYYEGNFKFPPQKWVLCPEQKKTFARIVKLLAQANIRLVLVQAPIIEELYNAYENNAEFDKYFSSLAPYYNFNEILDLPSREMFYDGDHLNQNGVIAFNEALIRVLQRDGFIAPEMIDEAGNYQEGDCISSNGRVKELDGS